MAVTPAGARDVATVKADILRLARQITATQTTAAAKAGRAALRAQLDGLVQELLHLVPQKPLKQRLPQLIGTWATVLAPSDKPDQGRKNPRIAVDKVIQVVNGAGWYYNIIPFIDAIHPEKSKTGLLRGEYGFSDTEPTVLKIHYTRFYGCLGGLDDPAPWRFAALEEAGKLPNRVNIVPDLLLHVILPDETVLEVWSDNELRLAYGTRGKQSGKRSLYVMQKLAA